MSLAVKIFNDLWANGALTALLVVIYLLIKEIIKQLKAKHKYVHTVRALDEAERFAGIIIPELAKMSSMSNSDRKAEAIKFVSMKLMNHDIAIDHKTISAIVEKIYQYMKSEGHLDIDKPKVTSAPDKMPKSELDKVTEPNVHPTSEDIKKQIMSKPASNEATKGSVAHVLPTK